MSYVLTMIFEPGRLAQLVERHRSRIESLRDLPESVVILANYTFATMMMCQLHKSLIAAKQAFDMAIRLNDDRSKAYARAAVACAAFVSGEGDLAEASEYMGLSVEESGRTQDGYLQSWTGMLSAWRFLYLGLTDRGRTSALKLQERGRIRNDPRAAAVGLWTLGWLDIFDEKYEDALVHGSECIRISLTPFDREIGVQVKGTALIGLGRVAEGLELLRDHRRRAMANEFVFCRGGTDSPVGAAMVLQGDFSGGVHFLEDSIRYHDEKSGHVLGREFSRITLAEIYISQAKAESLIISHYQASSLFNSNVAYREEEGHETAA